MSSGPSAPSAHGHDHDHDHGHDHGHAHGHAHAERGSHDHAGGGHKHDDHSHKHGAHGHGHAHDGGHGHGHAHGGIDPSLFSSREAMRTLMLSLVVLGITAALQVVVVVLSNSVALLADTVHNVGDALTAVPLAIAFTLTRLKPTPRFGYGFGRSEDFAGLAVVLIILFSAVFAAYEAIARIINPHEPSYLLATAIAGIIGFIGNEWVAVYRIRAGRRLGSAALEADGYHARIDGFTSLAVVVGVAGVAAGFELADPIVGLLISAAIVRIVWNSAKEIGMRALDGVDPAVVEQIQSVALATPGVYSVRDARARWLGHVLCAELTVGVSSDQSIDAAHDTAGAVAHRLVDEVEHVKVTSVRPVPVDSH
jgi:cation diffusion facilitator family transporter